MIVDFKVEGNICVTLCPHGLNVKVFSYGCKQCPYYVRQFSRSQIICSSELKSIHWRKCKAGYKFPSDAIVIPDDERTTDRDPRLVRCAVWDSKFILIDELKKLPVDNG